MPDHISYTETYHPYENGLADLALDADLDARLAVADPRIGHQIAETITALIQEDGVNTETGEWLGDWSANDVVRNILDRNDMLDTAVKALIDDGWRETHEGPNGVGTLDDDDLRNIARVVLTATKHLDGAPQGCAP